VKILDDDGVLKYNGWGVNMGDKFEINYEQATTPWFNKEYSYLKYRAWNFVMIYTPNYII